MTTAELATRILSQLGFSTAVTMEPSADYRRDKIVKLIDEHKAQWRREELSRDVLWQIDRKAFIKIMVDKFLCWKLPEHFRPDAGISFTPEYNVEYMAAQGKPPCRHEPVGTNLFSADQAEQMFDDCFPDTVEVNERRMAEQGEPK